MKIPIALLLLSAVPMLGGIARLLGFAHVWVPDDHARFAADPIPAMLHIIGATSFATFGAFQFAKKRSRWHRQIGWVITPAGAIAALSGVWMTLTWAPKPYDNAALSVVRIIVATAMITSMILSISAARQRDIPGHKAWMTRAYALGSGGGTQFFTLLPFLIFASLRSAALQTTLMASGWLLNVIVAEWAIRRQAGSASSWASSQRLRARPPA